MNEIAPGITVDERVRFGKPVVAGTRVPVALVIGQLAGGASPDDVAAAYGLTRQGVLAALSHAARVLEDGCVRVQD
jgi:uncharacterized protein (DUF433 family)